MNIDEMKKQKEFVETEIANLLNHFVEDTGVSISDIDFITVGRIGHSPTHQVTLEVKL